MKFRAFAEKKDEELAYEFGVLQEKWRRARESAVVKTLKTVHLIRDIKKDMARIRTLQRMRKSEKK